MFEGLGLSPRLLSAVAAMGYTRPTPIQEIAIPEVLAGRDVLGCAQTGTGKTAAFVLPLLQLLDGGNGNGGRGREAKRRVRALVVTPTRELAAQIDDVARGVAEHTGHRIAVIYGGVGYDKQLKALRDGVDVLVATPGRLLDLKDRGEADLSSVRILVLDEADRMLDMGFWPDVRRIVSSLPVKRQNLLFSATMSPEVLRVIAKTLNEPVRVDVAPAYTPVEQVDQKVYPVATMQKTALLIKLLEAEHLERVLVFTRTKERADRLHTALKRSGVANEVIHGDRRQKHRDQAVEGFRDGRIRVLVATDVMARGIDIDGISHVVNYDMPDSVEDYVHRIGRTARAGAEGNAISLLGPEETALLREIEARMRRTVECVDVPGFAYHEDRIVPRADRNAAKSRNLAFGGRVMGRPRSRRIGRR
ncbi:MAG: DEAD/DEAH box helicase [Coriobacteriia bacterium]|nr:DEAD/DEAH box helicase [Coriobacteriia bacterium]